MNTFTGDKWTLHKYHSYLAQALVVQRNLKNVFFAIAIWDSAFVKKFMVTLHKMRWTSRLWPTMPLKDKWAEHKQDETWILWGILSELFLLGSLEGNLSIVCNNLLTTSERTNRISHLVPGLKSSPFYPLVRSWPNVAAINIRYLIIGKQNKSKQELAVQILLKLWLHTNITCFIIYC